MTAASKSSATPATNKGSSANSSVGSDQPEFVLKHRIAGAAFLLFFGALVLPWILGAPGEAKTSDLRNVASVVEDAANERVLNDSLVSAIAGEEQEIEEQVYISKITPLDSAASSEQSSAASVSAPTAGDNTNTKIESPKTPNVNPSVNKADSSSAVENSPAAITSGSAAIKPVAKKPDTIQRGTLDESDNRVPQSAVAATEIEVGWIVQVGVFTDKKGASRVVEDLEGKGFSPSTTIVDTNRGKATGTRIWLGPYAQRVDAAKAKSDLTEKTGEAGFIRAYP